jgi:hypothetical protein
LITSGVGFVAGGPALTTRGQHETDGSDGPAELKSDGAAGAGS